MNADVFLRQHAAYIAV